MNRKDFCRWVPFVALIVLLLTANGLAAPKSLVNDHIAALTDAQKQELNDYALAISEQFNLDAAIFLAAPDYAADQTLAQYAADSYHSSFGLSADGFILALDHEGGSWDLVALGAADDLLSADLRQSYFQAYQEQSTYYGGVLAYLQTVEASLGDLTAAGNQLAAGGEAGREAPGAGEANQPEGKPPLLIDQVGLLSAEEAQILLQRLEDISHRHNFDVVIAIVPELDHRDARLYAGDFFEEHGFGQGPKSDGSILLLATKDRDFGFAALGFGIRAFTGPGQQYLDTFFLPQLRQNRYFDAFMAYAEATDDFLIRAKSGKPYDRGNIPLNAEQRRTYQQYAIGGSLLLSLLLALGVTGAWKRQLRSVALRHGAEDYVRADSLVLAVQNDIFLYQQVLRTKRQKDDGDSSSFSTSSGSSATGHKGKY